MDQNYSPIPENIWEKEDTISQDGMKMLYEYADVFGVVVPDSAEKEKYPTLIRAMHDAGIDWDAIDVMTDKAAEVKSQQNISAAVSQQFEDIASQQTQGANQLSR